MKKQLSLFPDQNPPPAPKTKSLWRAIYRFFFGDDIFISYARRDAGRYATALAARLSDLGYICFLDQFGTDANRNLPSSLKQKIGMSTALVLIGTEGATSSRYVSEELNLFKQTGRPIHPIDVEDTLSKQDWPEIQGLTLIPECKRRVDRGKPSGPTLRQLKDASRYRRRRQWLRLSLISGVFMIFVAGAFAVYWLRQAAIAKDEAAKATSEAQRQSIIADSRRLANQSQTLLRQRPQALQRSIKLAMDALAKSSSIGVVTSEGDAALRESVARLPRYLRGSSYQGPISATALSPDGRYFAALADKNVRVFRAGESNAIKEFRCEENNVNLALTSDAKRLVIAFDNSVRIHNLEDNRSETIELWDAEVEDEYDAVSIDDIAISPEGRYLAIIKSEEDHGSRDSLADLEVGINEAVLWDLQTRTEIKALSWDQRHHDIAFSADGYLAVGAGELLRGQFEGYSGVVFIWRLSHKLRHGELSNELSDDDFVKETHRQPDEVYAISTARDAMYYVTDTGVYTRNGLGSFDMSTRFPTREDSQPGISNLAFTADGREVTMVVNQGNFIGDRELEVWDNTEGIDSAHFFLPGVAEVGFTHNNHVVANQVEARVFDPVNGVELPINGRSIKDQLTNVPDKNFASRDGRFSVYVVEGHAYVRDEWQGRTTIVKFAEELQKDHLWSSVSLGGEFLALAGFSPKDDSSKIAQAAIYHLNGDKYELNSIVALPEISDDGLYGKDTRLIISPDGQYLVTVTDYVARLWDIPSKKEITPPAVRDLSGEVKLVEMSNTGRFLALSYVRQPNDDNGSLESDPEEDYVDKDKILANTPSNILIVRVSDGTVTRQLEHSSEIRAIVFSPREQYVLTSGYDKRARLIELNSTRSPVQLPSDFVVTAAVFDHDEHYFAIGSYGGTFIFTMESPEQYTAFLPDSGEVRAVAFSRSGQFLVTSSRRDGTSHEDPQENHPLRVWLLRPADLLQHAQTKLGTIPSYRLAATTSTL